MPVHGMNMGKCPGNTADVKAIGYLGIFVNVTRIIVINEVVPDGLAKNNPRKHCETNANADRQPAAVHLTQAYRLRYLPLHARSLLRRPEVREMTAAQHATGLYPDLRAISNFAYHAVAPCRPG